jgi:hypothetical protein
MRIRPFLILALGLLSSPVLLAQNEAQPAQNADDGLYGRIEDGRYYSPLNLYDIPIPVLSELGGRIVDTNNVVTFQDAFTTHITIAVYPLDATQRWELKTRGTKDYLVHFFADLVLPEMRKSLPKTTIENGKFKPGVQNGALFLHTLLPGGSRFNQRLVLFGDQDSFPVAKRGNLLFIYGDNLFLISSELGERSTERSLYTLTPEQEEELISKRLLKILDSIHFAPLAPVATPAAVPTATPAAVPAAPVPAK